MLNKIIESCRYVSNNSKHVQISNEKIDEFIFNMKENNSSHWLYNNPFGILDFDVETIVNFLLIYHSIGFSYWGTPKWSIQTEYGILDGSYAMMYILIKELRNDNTFLDFRKLEKLPKDKLYDILRGNTEIPLFEERYNNIISACSVVNKVMNGSLYNYIKDIYIDKDLFNTIIDNFKAYSDTRTYNNKKIYMYKLAQILTSDILHVRQLKEKVKVDYSNLVGCADYKIPQILRGLGITKYSDELSYLIDNRKELVENSEFEVEIRSNMIIAIDTIKSRSNNKYNAIHINDYLWLMGQDKTRKFKPYHLTRTKTY